jgi:hypothetical protein
MKALSLDPLAAFLDEDLIQLSDMSSAELALQVAENRIDRRSITAPVVPLLARGHRKRPAPEGFVAMARAFGVEPTRDLQGADLSRLNLRAQMLEGADLRASDLSDSDLSQARLAGSDLSKAICVGTNFSHADLTGADLTGADLTGSLLTGADFTGVDMTNAKLSGTILDLTASQGVTFNPAELLILLENMLNFWWSNRTEPATQAAYKAYLAGDHALTKKLLAKVPVAGRPAAALISAAITALIGKPQAAVSLLNTFTLAETASPALASLIYAVAGDENRARSTLSGRHPR